MSSSPEHSIPVTRQDDINDIQKAREASNKALKNIQTLYNEIMTPKSYSDFEDELLGELSSNSTSYSPIHEKCTGPTVSVTSKINSDLCNSCRKYLSYCTSCRRSSKDKSISQRNSIICNNLLEQGNKYINEPVPKFKITVPKPFSLTVENIKRQEAKEIKIAKLKEDLEREAEKELNIKIRPHPVPKHVNLPIYEEMARRSETRKKERRGKCQEILEKETKPFNLSHSARMSRAKSVSDIPKESPEQFRARPVPKNILSENVSKRIKDKEKLRKILMTHRAEEMLKQSALPFTPKMIPRSYSMSNLSPEKDRNVKLTKPNIDAITKRLYVVKCKETIENWNSKVLASNNINPSRHTAVKKINDDLTKSKLPPEHMLPFYNFPVRMSTAAMLRDRQIREEIYARQRKEDQETMFQEEMARKRKDFQKNIWPRLKSVEPVMSSDKDIEERVKSFKVSQQIRMQEYEKEIEEMMKRVSKQCLLIERQSKDAKDIPKEGPIKSDDENSENDSSAEKETSRKYSSNEHSEKHSTNDDASETNLPNDDASEAHLSNQEDSDEHSSNKDISDKQSSNQDRTEKSEELEHSFAGSEKSEQ